ncbi:MAG: chromate transporter [Candidatus Riflebacteria bacterium]|nr:chromate transporter [Candidatus Riflebacteria bacterium]
MPQLLKLFLTFFKIGMFTLGGGYAMVPLIQREIVEKRQWIEEKEFYELLAMAQSSPGPVAVNASVFVGYKVGGVTGSIVATLGTTIPSFVIILIIAAWLVDYRSNPYVEAFFKGIRPAVVAMIAAPLYALSRAMNIGTAGLCLAAAVALLVAFAGISPAVLIAVVACASLLTGILRQRRQKQV